MQTTLLSAALRRAPGIARRALASAALLLAALPAAGCAAGPPLALDPGWAPIPDSDPPAVRYQVQDVEIRARKLGDEADGEPVEVAGTILGHGPGALTAEFLPPEDGIGAVTVVVTGSGGAPGTVPVGAPDDTPARRVTAVPGKRFPLVRNAPGSPQSLSFRLLPPDVFDAVEAEPDKRLRACRIVLRGEGYSLTIPFRFQVGDASAPDATTVLLLLLVLAGAVVWAATGDFFVVAW